MDRVFCFFPNDGVIYGGFPIIISNPPLFNIVSNSIFQLKALSPTTLESSTILLPHLIFLSRLGSLKPSRTPLEVANFKNKEDN